MSGQPRTPEAREWVLMKVCAHCKNRRPWAMFPRRTLWPDGSVRTPESYCYTCLRGQSGQGQLGLRLNAAPLVKWLRDVAAEEGGVTQLALDAGLNEDTLVKVVRRNRFVSQSTAEAALEARGRMLVEFYPLEATA